jgi:hypothetical protein
MVICINGVFQAASSLNRTNISFNIEYVAPFICLCWFRKFRYSVQWEFFFQSGCQSGLLRADVWVVRHRNVGVLSLDGIVKSPPQT